MSRASDYKCKEVIVRETATKTIVGQPCIISIVHQCKSEVAGRHVYSARTVVWVASIGRSLACAPYIYMHMSASNALAHVHTRIYIHTTRGLIHALALAGWGPSLYSEPHTPTRASYQESSVLGLWDNYEVCLSTSPKYFLTFFKGPGPWRIIAVDELTFYSHEFRNVNLVRSLSLWCKILKICFGSFSRGVFAWNMPYSWIAVDELWTNIAISKGINIVILFGFQIFL